MPGKTLAELSIGVPVPRSISYRASSTFCPSAIYGGEEMAMTAPNTERRSVKRSGGHKQTSAFSLVLIRHVRRPDKNNFWL